MTVVNDMKCASEGSLYTSQAAESYLRFPTLTSACTDWLPCQAEAVHDKLCFWGVVLFVFTILLHLAHTISACADWLLCQAEAVDAKTVLLGNCAFCVYTECVKYNQHKSSIL